MTFATTPTMPGNTGKMWLCDVAKVKTIAISYATATRSITFQAKTANIDHSRF
jgi:hypothetical protein